MLKNQTFKKSTKLSSINFENKYIFNIVRSLNIHMYKAHTHENISVRILKVVSATFLLLCF